MDLFDNQINENTAKTDEKFAYSAKIVDINKFISAIDLEKMQLYNILNRCLPYIQYDK